MSDAQAWMQIGKEINQLQSQIQQLNADVRYIMASLSEAPPQEGANAEKKEGR